MVDDFLFPKYATVFLLETAHVCGFSGNGGKFWD